MLLSLQDLNCTFPFLLLLYFLSYIGFFSPHLISFLSPPKHPHSISPFFTTPIHFILLHFIMAVTLLDSFSPSSLIPCLCLPLCRLDPLHRQHPGYSSITNAQDLWMTTAHLYCQRMIILYMRENQDTHAHAHTRHLICLQSCCTPPFVEIKPTLLLFYINLSFFITSWISHSHGTLHFFGLPFPLNTPMNLIPPLLCLVSSLCSPLLNAFFTLSLQHLCK